MDALLDKLGEILDVDELDGVKNFVDFEEWDSLSSLSVIAMLDADYKMSMSNKELLAYPSINAFCEDVLSRKK